MDTSSRGGATKWEAFRGQFNKLSRALKSSLEMQSDMLNQCREMKMQLVEKAQQLQVAQATKREDDLTIIGLRREMDKGAARADMLSVREKAAQRLVGELQQEVETLRAKLAAEEPGSPQASTAEEPPRAPLGGTATALLEPPFEPASLFTEESSLQLSVPQPQQPLPQLSPFEEWKRAKMVFSYGGGRGGGGEGGGGGGVVGGGFR